MQRNLAVIFSVLVASGAFAAGATGGAGAGKPECLPGDAFESDDVRLWFHGRKGFVKVFDKSDDGNGNDGMYMYTTGALVELDADGSEVARMHLGRAFPHTSSCTMEETDEWVNMTLTVTDTVRPAAGGDLGDATVTFAYHFNKTAMGAKFDLHVEAWPWQDEGTLAYDFRVHSGAYTIEDAENGLGFRDSDGNARGYIEWAPNATAHYDDGHNETALVDGHVDNDGHNADVRLEFTNATAGYTKLEYDPWAGVGDYVIVGGFLIGLAPIEQLLPRGVRALVRAAL